MGDQMLLSQPWKAVREPSSALSLHQALRLTQGFGTPSQSEALSPLQKEPICSLGGD